MRNAPEYTNALINAGSPYLLQHAHNPVNWYEFGADAIEKARREHKPIFLSIGYAACHWCHVMAHESFEDEDIAAILNQHFVSIKVDREERPDIDDIYMTAVQMMTGSGGWPLSVFLTPDLEPFFGGTYFPPEDRHGLKGFKSLLQEIASAWEERRDVIDRQADRLTAALKQLESGASEPGPLTTDLLARAAAVLRQDYDRNWGGFTPAPKFPQAAALRFILRRVFRTGDKELLAMAEHTLDRMAAGGMYDQIGGGFHRYSVDARWLVPHFEKMLYDNAQLALAYLEAYQLTDAPRYRRIAMETLDYVLRDMTDAQGGFHSSQDADSEGEEGRFYLWTLDELREIFGDDAWLLAEYYGVTTRGNFEGRNILYIARPHAELAQKKDIDADTLATRLQVMRDKLRKVRDTRVHPGKDDKILAAWNGLMISALARAAQTFEEPRYRSAAERAAEFITTTMMPDGVLHRSWRDGRLGPEGFLDDYACMAGALIDLYETTFEPKWLERAIALADGMNTRFWDPGGQSYYFTADTHTDTLARLRPAYDGATPSGNAVAALTLLRLGALTGRDTYTTRGEAVLQHFAPQMARSPSAFFAMLAAVDFDLGVPVEVVVAGPPHAAATRALLHAVYDSFIPARVVVLADPGASLTNTVFPLPLTEGRAPVDGRPAAYVCRNRTCGLPVTDPGKLSAQLAAQAAKLHATGKVQVE